MEDTGFSAIRMGGRPASEPATFSHGLTIASTTLGRGGLIVPSDAALLWGRDVQGVNASDVTLDSGYAFLGAQL